MALTTLRPDQGLTSSLLEEMLTYMNPDGLFQVDPLSLRGCCQTFYDGVDRKTFLTQRPTDVLRPGEASNRCSSQCECIGMLL